MHHDWSIAHVRNGDFEVSNISQAPSLMRTLPELEDDLKQRVVRNLRLVGSEIPQGYVHAEEVYRILAKSKLPDEYALSPEWKHAHSLYWQIEALKGNSEATLWHPA